jgi:putative aldouronate transport system permease protein
MAGATPESLRMALLVITVFPILCVYPFLQKYFVKGVMIGSVKG